MADRNAELQRGLYLIAKLQQAVLKERNLQEHPWYPELSKVLIHVHNLDEGGYRDEFVQAMRRVVDAMTQLGI